MSTDVKALFAKIMGEDKLMQAALQAIKEAAPGFKDIFKGTMKEKLDAVIHGLAAFLITFEDRALANYGIDRDTFIDGLAEYADSKITFTGVSGVFLEMVDGQVFHYLVTLAESKLRAQMKPAVIPAVVAVYRQLEADMP